MDRQPTITAAQGDVTIVANVLILAGGSSFKSLSTSSIAWNGPDESGALRVMFTVWSGEEPASPRRPSSDGSLPESLVIANGDAERTRTTLLAD